MRAVYQNDLFAWLPTMAGTGAVVAVLPDAEEIGLPINEWKTWFFRAARACVEASAGPTVFLQTDRLHGGQWHDKATLLHASLLGTGVDHPRLWHKIVLRRDVGKVDLHRPTYSHLVAYGPGGPGQRTPDVIDGGRPLWRNGIGVAAARFVIDYLHGQGVDTIVNPACGVGTLLAAAEERGMDAYGCDVDPDRILLAEEARLP